MYSPSKAVVSEAWRLLRRYIGRRVKYLGISWREALMLACALGDEAEEVARRYGFSDNPVEFWTKLRWGRAGIEQMVLVHRVLCGLERDLMARLEAFQKESEQAIETAILLVK